MPPRVQVGYLTSMSPVSKDQTSLPVAVAQTWISPAMSAVARYLESWLKPVHVTESLWPGEREGKQQQKQQTTILVL